MFTSRIRKLFELRSFYLICFRFSVDLFVASDSHKLCVLHKLSSTLKILRNVKNLRLLKFIICAFDTTAWVLEWKNITANCLKRHHGICSVIWCVNWRMEPPHGDIWWYMHYKLKNVTQYKHTQKAICYATSFFLDNDTAGWFGIIYWTNAELVKSKKVKFLNVIYNITLLHLKGFPTHCSLISIQIHVHSTALYKVLC